MHALIQQSLSIYNATPAAIRVAPSIPILYFGDRIAYDRSTIRIITVGLNPSLVEFPAANPFVRFPHAALNPTSIPHIEQALDSYFVAQPYRWFDCFNAILSGFRASYYPGGEHTALHTDLLSPVATNPTWGKLNLGTRTLLQQSGINLWHALVAQLEPHLVIISVAKSHLNSITFASVQNWTPVYTVPRNRPYHFLYASKRLPSGHVTDFIFGQAAQTPFGHVSNHVKAGIGPRLAGQLVHW